MSFKFLPEHPLKSKVSLDFGHKEIVATLNKVISNQSWNITIGLFGNWGTGKSTIIETLRDELKPGKIPMVIFDVWKHDGDALRRTFLKECASQLTSELYGNDYLNEDIVLNDRLVSGRTKSEEVFSIKWGKLTRSIIIAVLFGAGFFLMGIVIYGLLLAMDVNLLDHVKTSELTNFLAGGITASIVFKFFESFIKTEKTDVREDKYQDPHEFELEFKNLVESLKNQPKKVVITFDNLDRVSGDSALSIISTIKTFLDFKGSKNKPSSVIFLMPCDIDSMKRHIRQSLKSKEGVEDNHYIDEFLRKFFNTSIWIPDFYGTDLEKFATTKLSETAIPEFNNAYLSWLIIKVFNKNPRQIIQFINHLVSNYLLFEQVCLQNGLSDAEFHTKNVPQLAKFLLLKQRHPECLEIYRSRQIYILEDEVILDEIKDETFKELLTQTADIYIPSLEPYFKGRATLEEQQFPGIVKLLDLMKYDVDEHLDHAKGLQLVENREAFDSIVKGEFNRLNNVVGKTIFLNHLLELTSAYDITLSQGFYRDIINFVLNDAHAEVFYKINAFHLSPEIFAKAGRAVTNQDQKKVLTRYLDITCNTKKDTEKIGAENSQRFFHQIFQFFTTNKSLFLPAQISRLKSYFNEHPDEFDLRYHFFVDEPTQRFFIPDNLIEHVLSSFSRNVSQNDFFRNIDLVHRLHPPFDYTERLLEIYVEFWTNKIFSKSSDEDIDAKRMSGEYIRILRERIEIATLNNFEISNALTRRLSSHIKGLAEDDLSDWLILIHRMLAHKESVSQMTEIMSAILNSGRQKNIAALLALFPKRETLLDLDAQFLEQYLVYIAKLPFEKDNFLPLSNEHIVKIMERLVEWGDFERAEIVTTTFRDHLTPDFKQSFFNFLTTSIEEAISYKESVAQIEKRFKLILLLSDLVPETLEQSGFWNMLPHLLSGQSSEEESALAKGLLIENQQLLSPKMAEWLFATLVGAMDAQGIYRNDQFHETLNLLRAKVSEDSQNMYVDRVLRHIVRFTSSHNITLLAAEALEKSKFNVDGQLNNILDLENYINSSMSDADLERIKPVLNCLIKMLKRKQKNEFKELTIRLQNLVAR